MAQCIELHSSAALLLTSAHLSIPHTTGTLAQTFVLETSTSLADISAAPKRFSSGFISSESCRPRTSCTAGPWRNLPPGPRRLPIIGNTLQLMDKHWLLSKNCKEGFAHHRSQQSQGGLCLLECRAGKYSDRPHFVMVQKVLTNDLLLPFQTNGERWRRMRRAAHEALTKRAVRNYHPIQMKEATILALSVLSSSASCNRDKEFQRLAASTIMSIVYDYPTLLQRIEQHFNRINHAATPESFLVNILPWMMYIPERSWDFFIYLAACADLEVLERFARWKREGLRQYTEDYEMFQGLLNRVRVDLANGSDRPSFGASLLQRPDHNRLSDPEMTFLAGVLYLAGSETTATTLSWWTLAMIAFPEVQRRAQAELDAVIGRERLPTFADSPRLPYLHAIIKEILRWRPSTPFGIPRASSEEDWYKGTFVPKGTVCMANIWHCNHDRAVFGQDADQFRPERHLDDEHGGLSSGPLETNRQGHVSFGFGRRVCVAGIWLTYALY
ncbi:cytochrome P450 [Lactifluus volemus]|nr:cytochrome P450 [Lactifluus volemus]